MKRAMEQQFDVRARRFKPYPEYRDSGVEWLGIIPAHWDVKRLKQTASINDDALPESADPDLVLMYVDIAGVDSTNGIVGKEPLTFAKAPSRARRQVRHGDVVVSCVRTYLRAIAPIVDPEPNLVVSTGFAVVRPRGQLVSAFAAYALRATYFVERIVAHSTGVSYPAINASEMATFRLALPPEPEQRAIATFLDRETGKIDALVAKKERLIELLQEKRTALITRAVTKGLDPNVPMKDSGVEWLGDIPAHWVVARVQHVAKIINGYPFDSARFTLDQGLPLIRIRDLYSTSTEVFYDGAEVREAVVMPGEVLIGMDGDFNIGLWRGLRALLNQRMCCLRSGSSDLDKFLAYVLPFPLKITNSLTFSTTVKHLSSHDVAKIRVGLPPTGELEMILDHLDAAVSRTNRLLERISHGIDRLKEVRTALISAAVTGKIDVREEAG